MWKALSLVGGVGVSGLLAHKLVPETGYVSYAANSPIEDRYVVSDLNNHKAKCAAVFDGHGGWQVADFLHKNLVPKLESTVSKYSNLKPNTQKILTEVFDALEEEIYQNAKGSYSMGFGNVSSVGACGLVAILVEDTLAVANAGDCQAVVVKVKDGKVTGENVCEIHSSNIESEKQKLRKEHPGEEDIVLCKHPKACYVKGRLMPTRCFGDFYLKHQEFNNPEGLTSLYGFRKPKIKDFTGPYITHKPDVKVLKVDSESKFLILATDGLWDEMDEPTAAQIAYEAGSPQEAAKALLEKALEAAAKDRGITLEQLKSLQQGYRRRAHDDITIVVLPLSNP